MTVNSAGENNRAAGRDFNENKIQIDKYDGRNTVNIAIPSEKEDIRPLVKAQRKELNCLVAAITESGDNEAFVIWQKVHAEIGVSSIEDMTINQYHAALSFLQAMLDRLKEKDASKALVSLLLRNSEDDEIRQKLIRYCHINFGTGRLNNLTRPQLQLALSWLDQNAEITAQDNSSSQPIRLSFTKLIQTYPKEIVLFFALGVLLGAFIF